MENLIKIDDLGGTPILGRRATNLYIGILQPLPYLF